MTTLRSHCNPLDRSLLIAPTLTEEKAPRQRVSRHRVREGLAELILTGQRRPGTKLVQADLAEHFQVAQSVVREALLELQLSGLVETVDGRGMFVGQLTRKRLGDAILVRAALEALAVRLCCEHATRAEIRHLRDIAQQIHALGKGGEKNRAEAASRDRQFHLRLIDLSGNAMLIQLDTHYRVLGKILRFDKPRDQVLREHLAILDAIESGNADEADRLMRDHVLHGKRLLDENAEGHKFIPRWVE